jgi:hypothetical protein
MKSDCLQLDRNDAEIIYRIMDVLRTDNEAGPLLEYADTWKSLLGFFVYLYRVIITKLMLRIWETVILQ